jgi:hypothetical protein
MGGPSSAGAPLRDGRMSGLQPELLLRHARQLAERSTDTESPRSVHARRAVSAAYYALFHRVCMGVASTVVPRESDRARWELCRTFDHKAVETVARWVGGQQRPPRPSAGTGWQHLLGALAGERDYGVPPTAPGALRSRKRSSESASASGRGATIRRLAPASA